MSICSDGNTVLGIDSVELAKGNVAFESFDPPLYEQSLETQFRSERVVCCGESSGSCDGGNHIPDSAGTGDHQNSTVTQNDDERRTRENPPGGGPDGSDDGDDSNDEDDRKDDEGKGDGEKSGDEEDADGDDEEEEEKEDDVERVMSDWKDADLQELVQRLGRRELAGTTWSTTKEFRDLVDIIDGLRNRETRKEGQEFIWSRDEKARKYRKQRKQLANRKEKIEPPYLMGLLEENLQQNEPTNPGSIDHEARHRNGIPCDVCKFHKGVGCRSLSCKFCHHSTHSPPPSSSSSKVQRRIKKEMRIKTPSPDSDRW